MTTTLKPAPEFVMQSWLNAPQPLSLTGLRGRVVVAYAFQMLCPGCVERSIPQAREVHAMFPTAEVAVIGLHTVFEHHEAMGQASLKAFIHEYGLTFPVGIDKPSDNPKDPIPATMRLYNMQGTPTLLLIDRRGILRKQKFGHEHDLILGAEIMALMREDPRDHNEATQEIKHS
ncbi:MAG: redoxin domain-containing protein [Alphaproteobacteria bacterium]